jgi:hypothetical protein
MRFVVEINNRSFALNFRETQELLGILSSAVPVDRRKWQGPYYLAEPGEFGLNLRQTQVIFSPQPPEEEPKAEAAE